VKQVIPTLNLVGTLSTSPRTRGQSGNAVKRVPTTLIVLVWLLFSNLQLIAQPDSPLEKIPPLLPPRGEIPPSFWEQHGLLVVLVGLLLLGLVCAGIWWLMRPKAPVITPPAEQARQALEPLGRQPEDGAVLSRVSQVMRHYLAAAFGLPAGEQTTAEFSRVLVSHAAIGPALSVPVTNFLRQCDERKFAPGSAGAPLGAVAQALQLLEQAEARRRALSALATAGPSSPP
jgi:hypothetical protein